MIQDWSIPAVVQSTMALAEAGSFDSRHFADDILQGSISQPPPEPMALGFPDLGQNTDAEALGLALTTATGSSPSDAWRPAHHIMSGLDTQAGCLGSALFPSQGLDFAGVAGHAPLNHHIESSFSQLPRNYMNAHLSNMPSYSCEDAFLQYPQVVVPSELSPDEDYTTCSALEHNHSPDHSDMPPNSFESAATSDMLDYDFVDPPSPPNRHFCLSDEEGYVLVKRDPGATQFKDEITHWYGDSKSLPIRSKRRPSKRLRSGTKTATWNSHISSDFKCYFEIDRKGWDGQIPLDVAQSHKPHECRHRNLDGTSCGRRFDRSEHLKRHKKSHSNIRDYPCPLPGCNKAMGRPDNAGDHFKTHLRPPKPMKRNGHVEWHVLEAAIESTYTDKEKAKKLLDGLRQWVEAGMPDSAGSRRSLRE